MKRVICLLVVLVMVVVPCGCKKAEAEKNDSTNSTSDRSLVYKQADEMEEKLIDYLGNMGVFHDTYMNVTIKHGLDLTKSKTDIWIILNGGFADDYDDVVILAEGYYTALTLYFGVDEIKEYDVHVLFAGRYEFLNNELVAVLEN